MLFASLGRTFFLSNFKCSGGIGRPLSRCRPFTICKLRSGGKHGKWTGYFELAGMFHQLSHLNHGRVSFAHDHPMHSLKGLEIMPVPSSSQATQKVKHLKRGKSLHGVDFPEFPTSDPSGLNTLGEPSFDFFQLLPLSLSDSTDQLAKFKEEHEPREEENDQNSDDVDIKEMFDGEPENLGEPTISRIGRDHYLCLDNIRNWLSTQGYLRSLFERSDHQPESRISMHFMKEWLRGSSISTLVKEYKQKKKDQLRIRRAQAHAALSVAEVAAAIAGFAANSGNSWDSALASAASLVAAVCAKAAESMGADRTHVSLIIDSAVGGNSTNNIFPLTDSAATCLRCAATRRYKAQTKIADCIYQNTPAFTPQAVMDNTSTHEHCSSMIDEKALSKGADLLISEGGKKALPRKVSITFKQERVVLKLTKKCFGGAFTTSKQYHIKVVPQQVQEESSYLLKLETADSGTICIFSVIKATRNMGNHNHIPSNQQGSTVTPGHVSYPFTWSDAYSISTTQVSRRYI